jgi:hydroxyacylglutathione hydrolase
MAAQVSASQDGWFTYWPAGHDVYAISDHGSDMMYLVLGSERSLLVDTGFGIGDLAGLAASLTNAPVVLVNTHGHVDHASGDAAFSPVHIGQGDRAFISRPYDPVRRRSIMQRFQDTTLPAAFQPDAWRTRAPETIVTVKDGHVFKLGNRQLEVILVPGHSHGSLCLIDRASRLLFSGDTLVPGHVWMHLHESTTLRQYRDSLDRLRQAAGEFDAVFSGHGNEHVLPLPPRLLDDVMTIVDRILAGEVTGVPHSTFAGDGLLYDSGRCAIVYRADRLG